MGDELTDFRLNELTKLIDKIQLYIESNELRMRNLEVSFTSLQTSNKNYIKFFGILVAFVSIVSNIVIKLI